MHAKFKKLTRNISKGYKKGQWNRFIISFLILAQLGLLAIADGWASPPEALKTPIKAEENYATGAAGGPASDTAPETAWNAVPKTARKIVQDSAKDPAAEAATFQELLQVSGADLDRGVIYAWMQVPQPSGYNGTEKGPQNLSARCQQIIVEQSEKTFGQKAKPQPNSLLDKDKDKADSCMADVYLMETKQGELIKISTKRIGVINTELNGAGQDSDEPNGRAVSSDDLGAASCYLLVEVSQITSIDRAVLLRQLVTQALEATQADVLSDSLEPGSLVTKGIDSGGIVSDGAEPEGTEPNGIGPDGTDPNGIESYDIGAAPVKSSLNLTISRNGHLTQAEQLQLIERMLTTAGAGPSQGLNSSQLISLTAYTPRLGACEILAGEPVNLQVASRYHSLDNRTYFQIGVPLLMIEY